jgi:hypothetical protein
MSDIQKAKRYYNDPRRAASKEKMMSKTVHTIKNCDRKQYKLDGKTYYGLYKESKRKPGRYVKALGRKYCRGPYIARLKKRNSRRKQRRKQRQEKFDKYIADHGGIEAMVNQMRKEASERPRRPKRIEYSKILNSEPTASTTTSVSSSIEPSRESFDMNDDLFNDGNDGNSSMQPTSVPASAAREQPKPKPKKSAAARKKRPTQAELRAKAARIQKFHNAQYRKEKPKPKPKPKQRTIKRSKIDKMLDKIQNVHQQNPASVSGAVAGLLVTALSNLGFEDADEQKILDKFEQSEHKYVDDFIDAEFKRYKINIVEDTASPAAASSASSTIRPQPKVHPKSKSLLGLFPAIRGNLSRYDLIPEAVKDMVKTMQRQGFTVNEETYLKIQRVLYRIFQASAAQTKKTVLDLYVDLGFMNEKYRSKRKFAQPKDLKKLISNAEHLIRKSKTWTETVRDRLAKMIGSEIRKYNNDITQEEVKTILHDGGTAALVNIKKTIYNLFVELDAMNLTHLALVGDDSDSDSDSDSNLK